MVKQINLKFLLVLYIVCTALLVTMASDIIIHARTGEPISIEKQNCLNAFTKSLGEQVCKDK